MEPRKRIVAILATLATVIAVMALARIGTTPAMALLYAGLPPQSAGEVVAALEAKGIAYEVRGEAIYVAEETRDAARLDLAAQNLPASGTAGYELLDTLSGFGTTSEMFDATYWRAKEGELARTLLAAPGIKAARVHIANPVRRPFQDAASPSASVTLTPGAGGIDAGQAQAARYLVASAVAGLTPENVTVIDSESGVLLRAGEAGPGMGTIPTATERGAEMRAKLERLLAARVGDGRAVVEVTVDTVTESETISERVIDPESRVPIATDTEESSENSQGAGPGGITIASNLPDPAATDQAATTTRAASNTRQRTNFEVSEVRRERVRVPGEIRRISAAVLVDGTIAPGPDGVPVWTERPQAELDALAELVRSAIGFDAARGDVVTIDSLEFTPPPALGTLVETNAAGFLVRNAMTLIQMGVLGVVALLLGLFVLRPMLTATPAVALPPPAPDLVGSEGELAAAFEAAGELLPANPEATQRLMSLREVITERAEESTILLRSWLETREPGEDPA